MEGHPFPIGRPVAHHGLDQLFQHSPRKPFPRHYTVIQEGGHNEFFYLIIRGKVKVTSYNRDGKEFILAVLRPGDYFGEMALIDGGPAGATVITMEQTELTVVSESEFRAAMKNQPELAMDIMLGLISRLRMANEKMSSLALLDVYGRVARVLMQLAVPRNGQYVIDEQFTQQELANMVGATREMVSRILRDLVHSGVITMTGKQIAFNEGFASTPLA